MPAHEWPAATTTGRWSPSNDSIRMKLILRGSKNHTIYRPLSVRPLNRISSHQNVAMIVSQVASNFDYLWTLSRRPPARRLILCRCCSQVFLRTGRSLM